MHERRKQLTEKNHLIFLMTKTEFLWTLKFTAGKFTSKNWKRNQSLHTSLLSVFLPCSTLAECTTKAYLVCSIA